VVIILSVTFNLSKKNLNESYLDEYQKKMKELDRLIYEVNNYNVGYILNKMN
jgi:hypothetical protein